MANVRFKKSKSGRLLFRAWILVSVLTLSSIVAVPAFLVGPAAAQSQTVSVPSDGTSVSVPVTQGASYTLQAAGTFNMATWTSGWFADSFHATRDGWASLSGDDVYLEIDGAKPATQSYRSDHIYTFPYPSGGRTAVIFRIFDSDYGDNEGLLTVTVTDSAPPPQCGDGVDNDGDGQTDYPADPGCSSSTDNDETNPPPGTSLPCDGSTVSLPATAGRSYTVSVEGTCNIATWTTCWHADAFYATRDCWSSLSGDNVGLEVDGTRAVPQGYRSDHRYSFARVATGSAIAFRFFDTNHGDNADSLTVGIAAGPQSQCSDGSDNDSDGRTDFPDDPGCGSPADDDESNPPPTTVTVPSDGRTVQVPVNPGSNYEVVIEGTFNIAVWTSCWHADAFHSTHDCWSSRSFDEVWLEVDGRRTPGKAYRADHRYTFTYTAAGSFVVLGIHDSATADNAGSLTASFTASQNPCSDIDFDFLISCDELAQGTVDTDVDSDDDGLSDYVESTNWHRRAYVFCRGGAAPCDLPHPASRDVYVEIDWMPQQAPSVDALLLVKNAYASRGVSIHFDDGWLGGGQEVPRRSPSNGRDLLLGPDNYYDDHFVRPGDGDRRGVYHYFLSAERSNNGAAGEAQTPGVRLVVYSQEVSLPSDSVGVRDQKVANTIMMELGHNLLGYFVTDTFECENIRGDWWVRTRHNPDLGHFNAPEIGASCGAAPDQDFFSHSTSPNDAMCNCGSGTVVDYEPATWAALKPWMSFPAEGTFVAACAPLISDGTLGSLLFAGCELE